MHARTRTHTHTTCTRTPHTLNADMNTFTIFRSSTSLFYGDISKLNEVIQEYINQYMNRFRLVHIPKDGVCVLSAFQGNMRNVMKIDIEIEDLKTGLRCEILSNIDNYKPFVVNDVDIPLELERYLDNPLENFDTSSCDFYIIALANYFRVNVKILHSNTPRCWLSEYIDINPTSGEILYFARSLSNHIDAIIQSMQI